MFFTSYLVIFSVIDLYFVFAIWPPPYKVELKHSEEFIIGESPSNEDYFDDEMIKDLEIEKFRLDKETHKFERLHRHVKRYNDKLNENKYYLKNNKYVNKHNETYYDLAQFDPVQAGFVDKNKNFITNQENKNVYYLNDITKQLIAQEIKEKREETKNDDNNDYNYEELYKEYQMQIAKEQQMNDTFNATKNDDNDSLKHEINEIIDFKSTPRNCTAEELEGIGYGAVKCVWLDAKVAKTKESRLELFHRAKRIIMIWFLIYAAIAIPCWCHKGWCCCCFRCKFCKPRKRIDEAKKYLMDNPPGVYLTKTGETIVYEPNIYELHAYEKLDRALMNL